MTGQLRFLVVDDTDDIRDMMMRMVQRAGHPAEGAADGVEATIALAEHRYDVMLLDLSMPRMSGEDVVRWLGAHPDRGRRHAHRGRDRVGRRPTRSPARAQGSPPSCPNHSGANT
ncbi:response regulator [Nocardioides sp. B-3]|uniref:response regulator n=1 Tax=Nocardioides sp. B-3 TaxID=2895565 RepID=UPI0021537E6A|nr:response regulator [Nocardioides sp. B-3]UUZ60966.1 response regulator [Nocardioides sp. B-3]